MGKIILALTTSLLLTSCNGDTEYTEKKWIRQCPQLHQQIELAEFVLKCSRGGADSLVGFCEATGINIFCPMVLVCREVKCTSSWGTHKCEMSSWMPCPNRTEGASSEYLEEVTWDQE